MVRLGIIGMGYTGQQQALAAAAADRVVMVEMTHRFYPPMRVAMTAALEEFAAAVEQGRLAVPSAGDTLAVHRLLDRFYRDIDKTR